MLLDSTFPIASTFCPIAKVDDSHTYIGYFADFKSSNGACFIGMLNVRSGNPVPKLLGSSLFCFPDNYVTFIEESGFQDTDLPSSGFFRERDQELKSALNETWTAYKAKYDYDNLGEPRPEV